MRTLFVKIFLSFWLTIVLMGVPFYLIGLKHRSEHPFSAMHQLTERAVAAYGEDARAAWLTGGLSGLAIFVENLHRQSGMTLYLLRDGVSLLASQPLPLEAEAALGRERFGKRGEPPRSAPVAHWFSHSLADRAGDPAETLTVVLSMPDPPLRRLISLLSVQAPGTIFCSIPWPAVSSATSSRDRLPRLSGNCARRQI